MALMYMRIETCFVDGLREEQITKAVQLHQSFWHDYALKSPDDVRTKIGVYGRDGIGFVCVDGDPKVVCEAITINTTGRDEDIPRDYSELVTRADKNGNTRILNTFTVERSARRIPVNGTNLTDAALRHFLCYFSDRDFEITFSPDTDAAQRMHERNDAYPILLLENARPGLEIENVRAENVRPRGYKWFRNGSLYVSPSITKPQEPYFTPAYSRA